MAKAPKTKTQKGGRKPAKGASDDPQNQLQDIFGPDDQVDDSEADVTDDDVTPTDQFDRPIVNPTVSAVDDDEEPEEEPSEELEEEPEGDVEPTKAAKDAKGKEKPTSLDEAALMKLLPEKFQGKDLAESIQKIVGSFGTLEASDGQTKQELAQATKILKSLGSQVAPIKPTPTLRPTVPAQTAQAAPEMTQAEEQALQQVFTDMDILTDPVTPLKSIYMLARQAGEERAKANVAAAIAAERRDAEFRSFQASHEDFEMMRPLMIEVVNANPHLDHPDAIEMVYNKAKELWQMRQATQTTQTTESVVSNEQFKAFLEKRDADIAKAVKEDLLAKIGQGQAVKGTLDSGSAPTPTSKGRVEEPAKKKLHRIHTPAGDVMIDDEEVAGIITAEQYDDGGGLLNL